MHPALSSTPFWQECESDTDGTADYHCSYTKIGIIRFLLDETTRERAEWILWIDADTIIEELAFQMPYHLYDHHKKNFVTWGVKDMLLRGDQRHGAHSPRHVERRRRLQYPHIWWTHVRPALDGISIRLLHQTHTFMLDC